jgi:hypothetical protein
VFAAVLASLLAFAPPDDASAPVVTEAVQDEAAPDVNETAPGIRPPGTVTLAPDEPGEYQLFDGEGRQIGPSMRLGDDASPEMQLPAGVYYVHGPVGISPVVVGSGLQLVWDGARVLPIEVWQAERERQRVLDEARIADAAALEHDPPAPRVGWRAWASPLGSAVVPGLGQFMNGHGGKATGLLFGTLGSVVGAVALYNLGNYPQTRPVGAEYARL